MRGYSQLADIESLLLNISNKNIRVYAGEAIASYSAGAYRSAIVSIWITVVYDLYQKFSLLNEQYGDKAARKCIEEIDEIRSSRDKKQITAWEREILKKAHENVKIITSTEYEHLDRIQKDRHRCAHPVLDDEGFLFQPTPELVRTHIRTAIEVLLSQPPVIGKAAKDALIRDVEETRYFPDDIEGVKRALYKRHFQTSEKYKINLFKLSLKKILYLDAEVWEETDNTVPFDDLLPENVTERYVLVFQCLLREYGRLFESLEKESISNIISKIKETRYSFFLAMVYEEPAIWNMTPESIQERIKKYCQTISQSLDTKEDIAILLYATSIFSEFEDTISIKYSEFGSETKKRFIEFLKKISYIKREQRLINEIIVSNIKLFCSSSTFAYGRQNADFLILPIIEILNEDDIKLILQLSITEQCYGYDQLKDCTSCFQKIFQKTIGKYPSTLSDWKSFVEQKRERDWENFEELEKLVDSK